MNRLITTNIRCRVRYMLLMMRKQKQVNPYGVARLAEELSDGSFEIYGTLPEEAGDFHSCLLCLGENGSCLGSTFKT